MKNYCVIIGDIVESRRLAGRSEMQSAFNRALQNSNNQFKSEIVSPLTLTIGDEFQAVLKCDCPFLDLIAFFEQELRNSSAAIRFRYGVGLAAIDTEINRSAAIGMDGPAFHLARGSLEFAKKNAFKYHLNTAIETIDAQALNLLLHWIGLSENGWSTHKSNAVYLSAQNWTQKKIAVKLTVSQPAVSKMLTDPAVTLVAESRNHLQNTIKVAFQT